ncbi:MAG: hypothetical protein P1V35_01535, partial [Planctomycetota bacterium]|nr:hypothetical protein [Planctomycetota bacterium]
MKIHWLARIVFVLLSVLSLLAWLVFMGALAAGSWPQFEQLSNLRTHISVLLLGVGFLWFALRRKFPRARGMALTMAVFALFGLTPALALFGFSDDISEGAPEMRIGSVNLLFGIGHPEPVGAWMGEEKL